VEITLPLSTFFQLFTAFNALLLGAIAICRAHLKSAPILRVAGLALVLVATAMIIISADHAGYSAGLPNLALIESLLALAAGPVLVALVLAIVRRQVPVVALFLPPIVYASLVWLVLGANHELLSVPAVVLIQFIYTAIGWLLVATNNIDSKRTRAAIYTLVAMTILHAAQILRLIAPDVEFTRSIVPLVAGALFLVLTGAVAWSANSIPMLYNMRGDSKDVVRDSKIADALARLIKYQRLHLDRDLRLTHVASALGVPANDLSRAINASTGQSFSNYICRERVGAAKELLHDPDEQRTSVEAICLMSGFRSRSVFYCAFREETGMSPAEYRCHRVAAGK
jgi:AraC-like DNA-binding protein